MSDYEVNLASNDVGKKPQFVMGNAVGESREICNSRSSNVQCRKEAGFCYPSEERSTTAQEDVEGGTSSADNPILGASNTAYECNAGGFSLPVMSPADGGLILMQNGYNHIENDILCYDLPDIGNFDDIDGIFRNYDSTFGQGSSTLDELSRFSMSSPGVNGPEAFVDDADIMGKPMIQQQTQIISYSLKLLVARKPSRSMNNPGVSSCHVRISSCIRVQAVALKEIIGLHLFLNLPILYSRK